MFPSFSKTFAGISFFDSTMFAFSKTLLIFVLKVRKMLQFFKDFIVPLLFVAVFVGFICKCENDENKLKAKDYDNRGAKN